MTLSGRFTAIAAILGVLLLPSYRTLGIAVLSIGGFVMLGALFVAILEPPATGDKSDGGRK